MKGHFDPIWMAHLHRSTSDAAQGKRSAFILIKVCSSVTNISDRSQSNNHEQFYY